MPFFHTVATQAAYTSSYSAKWVLHYRDKSQQLKDMQSQIPNPQAKGYKVHAWELLSERKHSTRGGLYQLPPIRHEHSSLSLSHQCQA